MVKQTEGDNVDEIKDLYDDISRLSYRAGLWDGITWSVTVFFIIIILHGVFA